MGRGGSGCAEAGGRVGYMHSELTDGQGWLAGQHTATAHPVRHYQTYLPTRSQILPSSPPTCGVKNEILGSGGGPRRQQAGVAAVIGHRLQAGRQAITGHNTIDIRGRGLYFHNSRASGWGPQRAQQQGWPVTTNSRLAHLLNAGVVTQ